MHVEDPTKTGFMRSLCMGQIEEDLILPFPEMADSEKDTLRDLGGALEGLLAPRREDFRTWDREGDLPHPEFIRLKRGDATQAQNVFNGQIQSLVFIGEAFEGEITINDTQLFIKTEPDSDIKVSDTANFTVDPDHCLLVTR